MKGVTSKVSPECCRMYSVMEWEDISAKDIRKDIIQYQVGNGKIVIDTVLLTGDHVGEFEAVSCQILKPPDISERNKRRFYHTVHIQITKPFRIFMVGFVFYLQFCVFSVRKSNPKVMFLGDIENGDPIFADRFHTNIRTVIFSKPVT